jgi:asparagine synthase (glutamine-hydrolysing)
VVKLETALLALRELGVRPLWPYLRYRAGLWSGAYRRSTPCQSWTDHPLGRLLLPGVPSDAAGYSAYWREHRLDLVPTVSKLGSEQAVAQAEAILSGTYPAFGIQAGGRGFPPEWGAFLPPAPDSAQYHTGIHWSKIDLEALPADVKLVWELSRFSWVYPLARAYAHTGDPRYPQASLTLIDSWMAANPPNCGVHWVSAQEAGFRLLAAVFCLHACAPWFDEHPDGVKRLVQLIAVHARRIPPTLSYAQAQANNHLLIEAAALLTAGLLFPELREASRWESLGRRWLERGLQSQFFEDGGYVQFSSNYHRLALECGLWAACVGARAGMPLSAATQQALKRGASCLQALVDASTGLACNYGPNDGALLLRLTDCDTADYRPTLQLAWRVLHGERLYPAGAWDEACEWLGAASADVTLPAPPQARRGRLARARDPIRPERLDYPQAGFYRLEGLNSWALLRCARFRSRPGHSDQLHLDLWWRGVALATDGGAYLYHSDPPWDNGLAGAARHNTLVVDQQDPMLRAGRFLWLRWARGKRLGEWSSPGGEARLLSAEHDGYRSFGVVHRRSVLHLPPDGWWVVDDMLGEGEHEACLTWRLMDGPWKMQTEGVGLKTNIGAVALQLEGAMGPWGVYRAGRRLAGDGPDDPTRGWVSPTYSVLNPAVELAVHTGGMLPLRLITRFDLGEIRSGEAHIEWREPGAMPPVRAVSRGRFRWEL